MPLSCYLKSFPHPSKPDHVILFSTKRASKAVVHKNTLEAAENGALGEKEHATLARLGMIVDDLDAERREMLGFVDELNRLSTTMNISVIVNLDCNFACVYCYERDIKGRHYMTDETADQVVEFIKAKFTNEINKINIDFYGGEPLLARQTIKRIAGKTKAFAEGNGAEFSFTLVTNGSLLTRRVVEELNPLGFAGAKITLDGPPDMHNQTRPFKNGGGSFDAITGNISEIWDIARVGIGGNYGRSNWRRFPELIDILEERGLGPEQIAQLRFFPVMKVAGSEVPGSYRDDKMSSLACDGCVSSSEQWMAEADLALNAAVFRRGYKKASPGPSVCQVERDHMFVINHDGGIYRCPALIGMERFRLGDVRGGISDNGSAYAPGVWKNDECLGCAYLPLCFGGCRYSALAEFGDASRLDCRKEYLDRTLGASMLTEFHSAP
ncbi:MAG: geopeptide radical SAM maturase [Nitrospirae bacterium]|nr:geopeptide radical SAM maturase [Nitrospirota bacterium]